SNASARRARPRSACRVRTKAAAYAASSTRPTSSNLSSTRVAVSSSTPLRAIASASCCRLRAAPVSMRRAIDRATDSGSGSASWAAAPVAGGSGAHPRPVRPRAVLLTRYLSEVDGRVGQPLSRSVYPGTDAELLLDALLDLVREVGV